MKLRYYMRGLGIGILVTAILMSVTLHGRTKPMSDEEVIARAKELGMEEAYGNSVLADAVSANTSALQKETQKKTESETSDVMGTEASDETEVTSEAETAVQEAVTQEREAEQKQQTDALQPEEQPEQDTETTDDGQSGAKNEVQQEEQQEEPDEAQPAAGSVEITVNSGDGSLTVAKKLEQAGLVENAAEFDRFLCQYGYDKRICTGVHSFAAGASEEEIAKELTKKGK